MISPCSLISFLRTIGEADGLLSAETRLESQRGIAETVVGRLPEWSVADGRVTQAW